MNAELAHIYFFSLSQPACPKIFDVQLGSGFRDVCSQPLLRMSWNHQPPTNELEPPTSLFDIGTPGWNF